MSVADTESEEKRYAELQALALDFARQGETASLAPMLDHGLPVNLADLKGNSLLMLAVYNGNPGTARMLLEHGAEVDRANDRGQTPLGGAAFKGDTVSVELLLEYGAQLDADNGGGMTPIMFAALFGRTAVVEQLKDAGASLHRRAKFGVTAGRLVRLGKFFGRFRKPVTPPAG